MILTGSCLCGAVRYRVDGGVGNLTHCHCSMCRKAHGAAFGTYAPVAWTAFAWTAGEALVTSYRSSADVTRTFCSRCGANLQFARDDKPGFGLAVASLDDDPDRRATAQIWAQEKACWWDLPPDPPAYDVYPANRS